MIRVLAIPALILTLLPSFSPAAQPAPNSSPGSTQPAAAPAAAVTEVSGWIGRDDGGKWTMRDDDDKREYAVDPGKSTLAAGFDRVTAGKLPGQKAYAQLKGILSPAGKGAQQFEVTEVVFLNLQKPGGKATAVSVDRGDAPYGPVMATIDDRQVKVADAGQKAWLMSGGKCALYTAKGTGGYENEGQVLMKHDFTCTCKDKTQLAVPYQIKAVTEIETDGGRPVVLVEMADGGAGIGHVAVVDFTKNRPILKRDGAKVVKIEGQRVEIAYYEGEAAWNAVNEGKEAAPVKTETLDMAKALKVPEVGI